MKYNKPPPTIAAISKAVGITTFFFMAAFAHREKMFHGIVVAVDGGETAGTDGAELPTLAVVGDTLVVGTADGGLTPRLPIS